ncbi:MAG TPA: GNAT family N-acetyltransferase [Symbiobacteriaceae bacterium]|jgi:RimJ/RimL family protein N-acetyltransferase|nr:GNAT family N-acetyltransferase [Symbiobacteriaceae bacterium]
MEWRVRPAVAADYPRIAEITTSQLPEPVTAEELQEQEKQLPPDDRFVRLVVESPEGRVVGACSCLGSRFLKPGVFRTVIRVDQAYWNQGAGGLLYRELESWAREHGATHLQAEVREYHPHALDWAERRGYVVDQHVFESVLTLAGFDPAPFEGDLRAAEEAGFRFTTLDELGDDDATLERYFALVTEISEDIPGHEGRPRPPFELYRNMVRSNKKWSPARVFIGMDGDRLVASGELLPLEDGGLYHGGTGVARGYRGRGLSNAIKLVMVQYALREGARYLRTNNDSRNAPMLAVNRKFGYKQEPGYFRVTKALV